MPDPRVLYIVTAVVVLGLIAWVVAVLSFAPKVASHASGSPPEATPPGGPGEAPPHETPAGPGESPGQDEKKA